MAALPIFYCWVAGNQNASRALIMHSGCLGQAVKFFTYLIFLKTFSKFQTIKKLRLGDIRKMFSALQNSKSKKFIRILYQTSCECDFFEYNSIF